MSDGVDSNRNLNGYTSDIVKTNTLKVFDWIKAAKIIKENNIQNASIGIGILLEEAITILQNGKPIQIENIMLVSHNSIPVLIDKDSGEVINCFFIIDEPDLEYNYLQFSRSTESTKFSEWPKAALDIIKGAYYYKDVQESKLSQIYLIFPTLYLWKTLECGCFGI